MFYEISDDDALLEIPKDWKFLLGTGRRHFLFYLRDATFEVMADRWLFEQSPQNALLRLDKIEN